MKNLERMYVRVPIGALLRRVQELRGEILLRLGTDASESAVNEQLGKWVSNVAVLIATGVFAEADDPFLVAIRDFTDNPRFSGRPAGKGKRRGKQEAAE